MASASRTRPGPAARAVERLLLAMGDPDLRVRLPSGDEIGAPPERARGTVWLRDRRALLRALADPEMQFGELYTAGRLAVEGDLVSLLSSALRADAGQGWLRRLVPQRLIDGALRQDERRATENARHHYDVSNDFYRLWLDERMVYTCAYFPTPEASLEEAQLAKMDHVCRKVALRRGEHVVEAGSGWGSLALHMARYYGVTVRAYNVSEEQVAWSREQAEKQGLAERVEFVLDDWRNARGPCDAFVSVGMLEHVGVAHYEELGGVIDRCLGPHGRGLVHTIGRARPQRLNRWMRRRIFPHAEPPSLGQMMRIFEPCGLVVLDVENLRRHYERTAAHWLARFEAAWGEVEALVGAERARAWHLYLAGTVASFRASTVQLYQAVFTRHGNDAIPWTRAYLYTGEEDGFGPAGDPR